MLRGLRTALLSAVALSCFGVVAASGTVTSVLLSADAIDTSGEYSGEMYRLACSISVPAEIVTGTSCTLTTFTTFYSWGGGTKGCTRDSGEFRVALTMSLCSLPPPFTELGSVVVIEIGSASWTGYHCTGCTHSECSHWGSTGSPPFTLSGEWVRGWIGGGVCEIAGWVGPFQFPDVAGLLCDASGATAPKRSVTEQRAVLPINPYGPEGFLGSFTIRFGDTDHSSAYRITLRLPLQSSG